MRERSQRFDPRQEMQAETFEVFHYKEHRPEGVEVHHHDFYEVYYLLGGQVEYWVEGRIIQLKPGDILLINPMELHRPLVGPENTDYERIVLWINMAYLENLAPNGALCRCFDPKLPNLICPTASERPGLNAKMSDLVREYYSGEFGSETCAFGLFLQLMVQLNRMALQTGSLQQERQLSPLVQKALQYIADHIGEDISLDSIAGACYISKYHLSHAFSREVGISVYRYIMIKRLLMARQLLSAGEPAGQVCTTCGFSDYTSFYRAFKAEYGISPGAFSAE